MARAFVMEKTIKDILRRHRLRWLGHIARMEDHRLPKQMLFGELKKTQPRHGTKKRSRDVVAEDVESISLWYEETEMEKSL